MMTKKELINKLKPYFSIRELVCPHVYNRFKETAWQFLSTELLSTLYVLRTEVLNVPMVVNNWSLNKSYSQRGLRCNLCELVKNKKNVYLSAHCLGKAVDFTPSGMSAEDARTLIKKNLNKFEYPIRLEEGTSWVHIDCITMDDSIKLITFKE